MSAAGGYGSGLVSQSQLLLAGRPFEFLQRLPRRLKPSADERSFAAVNRCATQKQTILAPPKSKRLKTGYAASRRPFSKWRVTWA